MTTFVCLCVIQVERLKREFKKFEKLKREFDAAHGPKLEPNPDYGLEHRF